MRRSARLVHLSRLLETGTHVHELQTDTASHVSQEYLTRNTTRNVVPEVSTPFLSSIPSAASAQQAFFHHETFSYGLSTDLRVFDLRYLSHYSTVSIMMSLSVGVKTQYTKINQTAVA